MNTTEPPRTTRRRSIDDVCVQLGVPAKDWHLFKHWAAESLTSEALDQLYAYVDVMIAERCRQPGDDLLSELIATGVDGEDLTVDELHAIVVAMVSRTRPADAK
jgi:cytochrome P450